MLYSKKQKPGNAGINKCTKFSNILVDTNKKVYLKFWVLVPGCYNIQRDKAKSEDEILFYYFVIKAMDLVWNTFLSLLRV